VNDTQTCLGDSQPDNIGGQVLFNNPAYAAPYPSCTSASSLGTNYIFCPSNADSVFEQYHALWRDRGMISFTLSQNSNLITRFQAFTIFD
jgi:hypothetical protein